MNSMIASMGEILIDFLPIEEEGRTTGFRMHPGGSPYNVAVGLARLGMPSAFASKISTDLFGRYLRDHMTAEGIDDRYLVTDDAPTTLAFVSMEGGEPAYAFYAEGAADTQLTPEEIPQALFEETAILHFGSISLLRGTTPDAVLSAVQQLHTKSVISFDPNVRPGLIGNKASYIAMLEQFFALSDIVKISSADLSWLWPERSVEQAAAYLQARGPALVVVTRGSWGVYARRGAETWDVPAFNLEVADTVGAGDAFTAGLLASLFERKVTSRAALDALEASEIEASLRYAAAVSGLTCTRPGSDPPTAREVAQFLRS